MPKKYGYPKKAAHKGGGKKRRGQGGKLGYKNRYKQTGKA